MVPHRSIRTTGRTWLSRCSGEFSAVQRLTQKPAGFGATTNEPVVIHCYTTPRAIQDKDNLAELGRFCRRLGREANQGEVGLVVGDEYFAIRQFEEVRS